MRTVGAGLCLTIAWLCLASPALAQEDLGAQVGLIVKEVVFQGNRQYDDSTLGYSIRTKVGQKLSQGKLAEDVSTLLAFFERVTTEVEPVTGGVRIRFIVEENPIVSSVVFRGFANLTEKKAAGMLNTKKGYPFAEFKVESDQQTLLDEYKKLGYYFAEVKAAVGDYAAGKQVLFTAIEGPRVTVGKIRFEGNQAFDADTLEDSMEIEESALFTTGLFVKRTLDQDLVVLANFYRSEGYLDAVVTLRELEFSADKEDVTITIGIAEGMVYIISEIEIDGGHSFPPNRAELDAIVGALLVPGLPRREKDINFARQALSEFYLANAYYNVSVSPKTENDSLTYSSKVTYKIVEGDPVSVRRLDITGNTVTREDVIRRNLSIHPDGPLDSVALRKSEHRLDATGFFEPGSVRSTVKDTENPGEKDVTLHVAEGRTGSVRFSVGLTSDLGILGVFEITKRNFDYADLPSRFGDVLSGNAFTGGGQTLDLALSPGANYSQYRLAFTEPWAWGEYVFSGPSGQVEESPFSFGFDVFHSKFSRFDYDESRTGFGLTTGKYWIGHGREADDIVRARLGFRLENVRLDDLGSEAPPNAYTWEGLNRFNQLSLVLSWAHLDNPASPGNGFDLDALYMFAGGFLGGDINFNKAELGGTQYFTIYETKAAQRHILSVSARVGWSEEFGGNPEVPLFERFFAGGSTTVRGFEFGQVGPRAQGNPNTEAGREEIERSFEAGEGDPIGGQGLWLFRAEYGFPIYEQLLRGIVFMDAGNVAVDWNRNLWDKRRASLGFGFRIAIPFFGPTPVALDFAWPIKKEKNDELQVLSFSVDRPF